MHELFRLLFAHDDMVHLRFIETWSDNGRKQSDVLKQITLPCYQWAKRLQSINALAADVQANVFFGVCPRHTTTDNMEHHIKMVRCLWADVDHSTPLETLCRVKAANMPDPTVVVNSGNGTHLYWVLRSPVYLFPTDTICAAGHHLKGIIAGIAKAIGGDSTFDLSRVLRVPGTMNRKDERNGTQPTPCTIHTLSNNFYDLKTFEPYHMNIEPTATRQTYATEEVIDNGKQQTDLTPNQLRTTKDLIAKCDTADDRSKADFSLCVWAAKINLSPSALWDMVQDTGKFSENGSKYFNRTFSRAKKAVEREQLHRDQEVKSFLDTIPLF